MAVGDAEGGGAVARASAPPLLGTSCAGDEVPFPTVSGCSPLSWHPLVTHDANHRLLATKHLTPRDQSGHPLAPCFGHLFALRIGTQ